MKILLFLTLFITSHNSFSKSLGNSAIEAVFNKKVNSLYQKGMTCSPLENDAKSGLNITDWMPLRPAMPNWKMLLKIESVANQARGYASQIVGSDKVKHCLAGCFIAYKLDFKSGVMVGWLKELIDASDCSLETHFELNDFLATKAGAIYGARLGAQIAGGDCKKFCLSEEIKNLDGDEMLRSQYFEEKGTP